MPVDAVSPGIEDIVGLHGRENPKITPADVARIFENAGVLNRDGT